MNLAKRLLLSSRPISWINTAFPFAAAYYFLGGPIDSFFLIASFYFLIPYNLLMYGINDVFDYESDLRNPRKGGLEGGLLPPALHKPTLWIVGLTNIPFALFISLNVAGNAFALAIFLLTLYFVIAYSVKGLRYKEIPFLDSLTSAIHFVGPMVFALSLIGPITQPIILGTSAFFLWGVASHAFGAIQDIRADREAGISSIATVLGAKFTARFAFCFYILSAAVLLLLPDRFAFAAFATVPYLIVIGRELNISDENCERANRGWKLFLGLNFLAGAIVTSLLIGPV